MYLRMAFTLLDKNRNNLIDEADLLHLIGLSRTYPLLTKDALILARALLKSNTYNKPFFRSHNKSNMNRSPPRLLRKPTETYSI